MPSIPAQEHPCPRCARLEPDHCAVVERLRSERDHWRRLHSEERTQRRRLEATRAGLAEDMAKLNDQLSELSQKLFGSTSERLKAPVSDDIRVTADQKPPPSATADTSASRPGVQGTPTKDHRANAKPKTRRQGQRSKLPDDLPSEEIFLNPEGDLEGWKLIRIESTKVVAWVPGYLKEIHYRRRVFAHSTDPSKGLRIAPLPARTIPSGRVHESLLAHLVTSKVEDGLPLYRLAKIIERGSGYKIPSSTMGNWMDKVGFDLEQLALAVADQVRKSGYLQVDETTIRVQDRKKKGSTHRGYFWVYHCPKQKLLVYQYAPGRGSKVPRGFLHGFQGVLHTDGYVAYETFIRDVGIILANCWAHTRRKFYQALRTDPDRAAFVLKQIGKLYRIEAQLRENHASAEQRRIARQQKAKPVLRHLKSWLQQQNTLPKGLLGKAKHYTLARWDRLCRYIDDGRLEIDTNAVERAMRTVAIGRKNYLFCGSHHAAKQMATFYTLLATCRLHGVNPVKWLEDVLPRIAAGHPAKKIHLLLPHQWQPLHPPAPP